MDKSLKRLMIIKTIRNSLKLLRERDLELNREALIKEIVATATCSRRTAETYIKEAEEFEIPNGDQSTL